MRNIRVRLVTAAAIAGAAAGGAAIASAATSTSTTSSSGSASAAPPARSFPAHGTAAHEGAEKPVTGTAAAKARAAAVKALGGGSAGEVTTDYSQKGYEVTVTRSDGTKTEVHLDSSFSVIAGGRGGPHGDCPGMGAPGNSASGAGSGTGTPGSAGASTSAT